MLYGERGYYVAAELSCYSHSSLSAGLRIFFNATTAQRRLFRRELALFPKKLIIRLGFGTGYIAQGGDIGSKVGPFAALEQRSIPRDDLVAFIERV